MVSAANHLCHGKRQYAQSGILHFVQNDTFPLSRH
jgi:hypothetical protein